VSDNSTTGSGIQEEKKIFRLEMGLRHGADSENIRQTGRLAELLRRSPVYRSAKQVFVGPDPDLQQVRVNCLADGKELLMPSAGLKEGFYHYKPYAIPFIDLSFAASLQGAARFGRRLNEKQIADLDLSLFVTSALAVDRHGGRLGDGAGFFDLSFAILSTMTGVGQNAEVAVCVAADQIVDGVLPVTSWDVYGTLIVTSDEIHAVADTPIPSGQIYWEELTAKRIRKMKPLWLINNRMYAGKSNKK
jgi:5-formyltetrahydrofolate cyclo-ligase